MIEVKSLYRFIPPQCPHGLPQHLLRHDEAGPGVRCEAVHMVQDITVTLQSSTNILAHHGLRPCRLQTPLHLLLGDGVGHILALLLGGAVSLVMAHLIVLGVALLLGNLT